MKDKNIFDNKVSKSTIKYVVISFSVFILLLSVVSVVLLMHSIDYDINNLIDSSTSQTQIDDSSIANSEEFSVDGLTGASQLLFIVKNGKSVDFSFIVSTDFDKQTMKVKCLDGKNMVSYRGNIISISDIYATDYELGVKTAVYENFEIEIEKYIVLNQENLKEMLLLFDGFSVHVRDDVDYKSFDFNLSLKKGRQELSPDLTYKYLLISNNEVKESVWCDIISSVLTDNYINKSESLFKSFVNLCETDISIIDYYDSFDTIKTYCYASNKFYPVVWGKGDYQ